MDIVLTGRSWVRFCEWYFKDNDAIAVELWDEVICDLLEADDVIATAYVCDWFDSVGIFILPHPLINSDTNTATGKIWNWSVEVDGFTGYADVLNPAANRTEAIKKAIIKANEIFNNRQDG